ncbi:Glyceraldehyde-3-phosphate dehydrogenase (Phosphorylating) [Desulfamplus magnetovallimortis]|uniref:Glyceraldehyde-3-phosphate dehydrogenase (Phosphorylating) n=1 Tax=Desulfamplus magnetovallimortis TaxID=1246637 RepID=A0A1W1HII6_9BACT|nr:glyceraldehyde 3-phosphate dehydrogenase NAD-binding domain-containing protein [Desulfamplus magnetovallimortis]SLM32256.1 Glyceraldehyde-3-phosphate dehydrogenase (Phosphorylating) [Desulfamplus magnetovallimortis]
MEFEGNHSKLGINGFGRIGKLTAWHHIGRRFFDEIVINLGRDVGKGMEDIAHYMERDSTYGRLEAFLNGNNATPVISDINEAEGTLKADGVPIRFLRKNRNPADIKWKDNGVSIVVETTGQFLDPTIPAEDPKGSIRGHLKAGAEKVIASAPFKFKDKGMELKGAMPEDAVTTVMGINDHMYDPRKHSIISNASCTTNCLAHMMKPLLDVLGQKKILSASMATIHAATGSQQVLDRLPGSGKSDLRKNRSILNNIILTSTGAAKALRLVIPEMEKIGFIAESVRIPTTTGSLVILVLNLQEDMQGQQIRRNFINNIYREAALNDPRGYLHYTDKQNVSGDIIGSPRAAATIEGHETHTRTAEVNIDLTSVPGLDQSIISTLLTTTINVPVTQTVVYGWYDNEMGSYVNMLGDRTVSIAEDIC